MFRKLLAVLFAATLMAGGAWGVDVIDVGVPTPNNDTLDNANNSVGTASSSSSSHTAATNDIAIGSSTGGSDLKLGVIEATAGSIYIDGTTDGATGTFDGTAVDYALTVTSLTAGADINVLNDTDPSVTALTVTNGLSAGTTLTVKGVALSTTGGQVKITGLTTFTGASANIAGGNTATKKSIYTGGLDLDTAGYTDGGDVDLGAASTWGVTSDTTKAATVNITGTVIMTAEGEGLEITGASRATLGGFKWGAAIGTGQALLHVDEASTLTINNGESTPVTFTSASADSQTLSIDGGSTVTIANELKLTGDGDGSTSGQEALLVAGTGNALNAGSLTIGDATTPIATIVINGAGLTTKITRVTTINDTALYQVGGTADEYAGGIVVDAGGVLAGFADANTIIDTKSAWVTLQDGGKIQNIDTGGAFLFTIKGEGVEVINDVTNADKAIIDASVVNSGIAIEKDLKVVGDLDLTTAANADSKIVAGTYTQTAGIVTQTGAGGNFVVNNAASITGTGSEFRLLAGGTDATDTADFKGGLTIGTGATLKSIAGSGPAVTAHGITIGAGKALTLDGGKIDATASTASFIVTGADANTKIEVLGNGSEIIAGTSFQAATSPLIVNATYDPSATSGSLKISGTDATFGDIQIKKGELALDVTTLTTNKDLTIDSGAYLSNNKAVTITAAVSAAKAFNAKAGSNIEATGGNYILTGFDTAKLDGNMLFGVTASTVNTIDVQGAAATTTVGKDAVINLTMEAAQAAEALVNANNANAFVVITADAAATLTIDPNATFQNSALGQFVYEKDPGGTNKMVLKTATGFLPDYTGTGESRDQALINMQTAWDEFGSGAIIDRTLADAAYNTAVINPAAQRQSFLLDPTAANEWGDATFGQITLDMLGAIAGGASARSGYSEGIGKGIFRNGNVSETLNAGVGEIRGITSAIGTRNVQLRGQMAGAGDVYYEYANPTLLLNNDYANRIWAGYIGQWEKGDTRNDVSGYDYDSNGFIVGYDRLVGCNFAFGGAFAYSRGDYEDKAALTNSSKIDNYSFNGYATYSALNGVFASLFGGYTHQKNDINAVYARGASPSVAKSADYDTDYWHIGGQLGYDFQPIDGLVFTPSIGLHYISGRADSHFSNWFSTTNGGGYVSAANQKSLLLPVELAAQYTIDFSGSSRLTLEGNIGYSYNFMDDDSQADMVLANIGSGLATEPSEFIAGYTRDAGRHTFNAGAGLRYTVNRFDIGVKYDYYLQQDAHAHRVMGTVGLNF